MSDFADACDENPPAELHGCAQTPLIELARNVPKNLRAEWESQWHDDGTACGYSMAPVGKHLHDMADEIERLTAEKEALVHLVAGFVWAKACTLLDSGIDPRSYEIPNVIAKVSEALAARRDDE